MSKEKVRAQLSTMMDISEKYSLSDDVNVIRAAIDGIDVFMATTPIIGGFSTGKSSMLNVMLGDELLPTDITPETAVPTEIYYGANVVNQIDKNGCTSMGLRQFDPSRLTASEVSCVQIGYDNPFLKTIPNVKVVDMPGFDSGYEMHNRAIDNYLPRSLAYIIAFPANEPVIKESIRNFLGELKLSNTPVYLVITKCDKVTESDLNDAVDFYREETKKLLGVSNIRIECVRSKGKEKDASGLRNILSDIQKQSDKIFEMDYAGKIKEEAVSIEKYLLIRLKNTDMTDEELQAKISRINSEMESLNRKLAAEKEDFSQQVERAITKINNSIGSSLENSASVISSALKSGKDVNAKLNTIVRNAVKTGIKTEFEPAVTRYMNGLSSAIEVDNLYDDILDINGDSENMESLRNSLLNIAPTVGGLIGDSIGGAIAIAIGGGGAAAAGTAAAGTVAAGTATALAWAGPIGLVVGAAIGFGINAAINSAKSKRLNEEADKKTKQIIEMVSSQSQEKVRAELTQYVGDINRQIEENIENERGKLINALNDAHAEKKKNAEAAGQMKEQLNADLQTVRRIISEL